VAGEKCFAPVQRLRELRFHRVLGDAEPGGDFAVGQVFKFAEQENFAATRWQ
jgi:hypothetical protein